MWWALYVSGCKRVVVVLVVCRLLGIVNQERVVSFVSDGEDYVVGGVQRGGVLHDLLRRSSKLHCRCSREHVCVRASHYEL